jgi:hypothetical protein
MKTKFEEQEIMFQEEVTEASITIDEILKNVLINHLFVESPDLFELLRKCDTEVERIAETKKVIDIGAFVKSKVQLAVDTDYFDRRVAEMTGDFEKGLETVKSELLRNIEEKFDPTHSNSYTEKIQKFFDEKKEQFERSIQNSLKELTDGKKAISEKIDESFNPELRNSHISKLLEIVDKFQNEIKKDFNIEQEGSITHQMKQLIKTTLGEDGELTKSIDHRLSFDNPQSTVAILQENLLKKLDEIKTEITASKNAAETAQAALEKSTQKGYDFEDTLLDYLEKFARLHGDIVEDVSKVSGEVTRSKKGDFVYSVTSLNKTIAIEARNRNMQTPAKTLTEMEETILNRKSDCVLYIYADEYQLHKQVGAFQEYPPNKIVTHFGLWEIALKIAISRLTIESATIEGIDRTAVENEIESVKNSLKNFRTIKTAAKNILNESNKITNQADQIKKDISESLDRLSEIILTEWNYIP